MTNPNGCSFHDLKAAHRSGSIECAHSCGPLALATLVRVRYTTGRCEAPSTVDFILGKRGLKRRAIYVAPLASRSQRQRRRQWARLIAKVFEVHLLRCTCGATMRVIAFILDPAVITKILEHRPRPEVRAHAPPSG